MFARWNRMAKQFARIAKDITMAVKAGGPEPSSNPVLRRTIQNARAVNMPKDRIDSAIRRASGRDAANYQQVLYEGYAPHGVALLVETATDNPTRTVAAVRNIITKGGGNLATNGSVSFLFRKMGVFRLDPAGIDQDELELYLIDHGLDEMGRVSGEKGEPQLVIRCAFADFGKLQEALEARGIDTAVGRARVPLYGADRAARGSGHGSPRPDRSAGAGRRRPAGVPHARLRLTCAGRGEPAALCFRHRAGLSPRTGPRR